MELADDEKASKTFDALMQAIPWTAGHRAALEATKNKFHRTTLVTGHCDSGKTTIMVEKGVAVVSQNTDDKPTAKMLYVKERNLASDNVLSKLLKKDPNLFVVRAYAQQKTIYEVDDTSSADKLREPDMSNEDLALLDQVEDKIRETKSKRYTEARYFVKGWVLEFANHPADHNMPIAFTTGDGEADPDNKDPVNAFEIFSEGMTKLRQRLQARDEAQKQEQDSKAASGSKGKVKSGTSGQDGEAEKTDMLSEDEDRRLKQAFAACRIYVLRKTTVLVSTVASAGFDDFRKHFASAEDDKVWLKVDEATTIFGASMYIPLAKCFANYGKEIVLCAMYGDEKQLRPIVLESLPYAGRGSNRFAIQTSTPRTRLIKMTSSQRLATG